MPTYALIDKDGLYLNHSTLNTMSCGSFDMAWTTHDHEKAFLMIDRAKAKHIKLKIIEI